MKSAFGTTSTEISALKAREICAIIKTCREVQVEELKFGDLHIKFGSRRLPDFTEEKKAEVVSNSSPESESGPTTTETKEPEHTINAFEQAAMRQVILDQLMLDDPLAYEKVMIAGDLEQARVFDEKA